jgi:hypothetical protein
MTGSVAVVVVVVVVVVVEVVPLPPDAGGVVTAIFFFASVVAADDALVPQPAKASRLSESPAPRAPPSSLLNIFIPTPV